MTRDEAKLLLQACRPNGQDASQPVFAEALALAESDPELKAWWETQQVFDRKVAAKLEEIPLPADLRATILAGRKIEQRSSRLQPLHWLAVAALIAVLGVAGSFLFPRPASYSSPMVSTEYNSRILPMLGNDAPQLAELSPDRDKMMAWLKERNAPTGPVPAGMAALPTVGCQKFIVHNHTVSLICFSMTGGGIAHLFIIEKGALADPPGNTGPEFQQIHGWSTASWSDENKSYLLATHANADALKQLFL